eukprot:scaffold26225_cov61-Attheya_sp.AAC.6
MSLPDGRIVGHILSPSHSTNEVTSQSHNQCAHSEDFDRGVAEVVQSAFRVSTAVCLPLGKEELAQFFPEREGTLASGHNAFDGFLGYCNGNCSFSTDTRLSACQILSVHHHPLYVAHAHVDARITRLETGNMTASSH